MRDQAFKNVVSRIQWLAGAQPEQMSVLPMPLHVRFDVVVLLICAMSPIRMAIVPANKPNAKVQSQIPDGQKKKAKANEKDSDKKPGEVNIPVLQKLSWQRPLVADVHDATGVRDPGVDIEDWIRRVIKIPTEEPLIPGFRPVVVGDVCVYRNYSRMSATIIRKGKFARNEFTKPGCLIWQSVSMDRAFATALEKPHYRTTLMNWLKDNSNIDVVMMVIENTMTGSISTDGDNVYLVDELPVLRPDKPPPQQAALTSSMKSVIEYNLIYAYAAKTGKMQWRIGYDPWPNSPFEKSHFLGPPLPHQGKLYVLNEKNNGDLRLVCLTPDLGKVNWTLPLANIKNRDFTGRIRRTNAVELVAEGGTLYCPSNSGQLIAVDLKKRKVRWVFDEHEPKAPKGWKSLQRKQWRFPKVIVRDGKLVFTSPVNSSVWCLDAKKGKRLWRKDWDDAVYLAGVFDDAVLLVGKKSCRALSLKNGNVKWNLATGVPSGVGAVRDGLYYLPLAKDVESKKPALRVFDPARGVMQARLNIPRDIVPGNLVFAGDVLISQDAMTIRAWTLR